MGSNPTLSLRPLGRTAPIALAGFAMLATAAALLAGPVRARTHAPAPLVLRRADPAVDLAFPRYDRIVVVVEENRAGDAIVGSPNAPALTALAAGYGNAAAMFGETHPSEPNYLAMIGGDTFGIRDDDAWYCGPADGRPHCGGAKRAGYPPHDLAAPSLPEQLVSRGLTWRGYFGGLSQSGSTEIVSPASETAPAAAYAAKHDPFVNFGTLRNASDFARHVVPLEWFVRDLNAGALPNFSFVVPNQCEDMHGMAPGPRVPGGCSFLNAAELIRRGDRVAGDLVALVRASAYWNSAQNVAVVVTWDEDDGSTRGARGCCERDRNAGGGRIPTIVATNHGPRGVTDATPYNHYSLLRTVEDAFGIRQYLGHAADGDVGVVPMVPLFRIASPRAIGR